MADENVPVDVASLRRAARSICAETRSWSRFLGTTIGRPELEPEVFREILSYTLYHLESQDQTGTAPRPIEFYRALRAECGSVFSSWMQSPRHSSNVTPEPAADTVSPAIPLWRERQGLSKEVFEAFCRATGLGSEVLVGREDNLAALVFYIVIFSLYERAAPLNGIETQRLLRALRECRVQVGQSMTTRLKETEWSPKLSPPTEPRSQIENAILL